MTASKTALLLSVLLALVSCKTITVEQKPGQAPKPEPQSWTLNQVPRPRDRGDFEALLVQLRDGSEQDRVKAFVALQFDIPWCLLFVIEHLEDTEPFNGIACPIVNRSGTKISSVTIPASGFNTGAALELFLIGYFYRDPARTTFNKDRREGSVRLWMEWYAEREESFRWNSWGLYSSK